MADARTINAARQRDNAKMATKMTLNRIRSAMESAIGLMAECEATSDSQMLFHYGRAVELCEAFNSLAIIAGQLGIQCDRIDSGEFRDLCAAAKESAMGNGE